MTPQQFPIIRATLRNPGRFDATVEEIAAAVEHGSIRNVALAAAKATLSNAIHDAWTKYVQAPFFFGKGDAVSKEVNDVFWSFSLMNLHDVIAASRKLAKSKVQGPELDAMRAFCAEALPLAEAVASLKDKAVKGRAPSAASQQENPNKVVKTCPVCFRGIAVVRGTMAHHGYERPGIGFQTASCPGVRFKPLEVSSEGLEWLIGSLRRNLAHAQESHLKRDALQTLHARRSIRGPVEQITREDSLWPRVFADHVRRLENEINLLQQEIPVLAERLAKWKPEAAE
jgi:hypothetical protein